MPPLSPHLFWDVRQSEVDPEKHAPWLVQRVLEYGLWKDWQAIVQHYGKPALAETVIKIRSLDPRSLAFCSAWFRIPQSDFRCSTTKPSHRS